MKQLIYEMMCTHLLQRATRCVRLADRRSIAFAPEIPVHTHSVRFDLYMCVIQWETNPENASKIIRIYVSVAAERFTGTRMPIATSRNTKLRTYRIELCVRERTLTKLINNKLLHFG